MPKLICREKYLKEIRARDYQHSRKWYRDRLLVFVPMHANDGDRTRSIHNAIESVPEVTESPFQAAGVRVYTPCTNYLWYSSTNAGEEVREIIQHYLHQYSVENTAHFKAETFWFEVADRRPGVFLGTALFVPSLDDRQNPFTRRGMVELKVYTGESNAKGQLVDTFVVTYSDPEKMPAGLYTGQDRLIFGFDKRLPVYAHRPGEEHPVVDGPEFRVEALCAILPSAGSETSSSVYITDRCNEAAATIGSLDEEAKRSCYTLVSEKTSPRESLRPIVFGDDSGAESGVARIDVTTLLDDQSKLSYTAQLVLTPNIAYSRLRQDRTRLIPGGYFEVLGLLVPSPRENSRIEDVAVHFCAQAQLLPHAFARHQKSLLLKKARMRLPWSGDDAILVAPDDQTTSFHTGRDAEPVALDGSIMLRLLEPRSRLKFFDPGINREARERFSPRALDLKSRFYLLEPVMDNQNLGFFGVPTRSFDNSTDAERSLVSDPFAEASPVRFGRSSHLPDHLGVLLDWLDDAVRLTEIEPGERKDNSIGYAQYWQRHINLANERLFARQSLELRPSPTEGDAVRRLTLVEKFGGKETETALFDETVVLLGPLYCRYFEGEAETGESEL